MYFAMKLMNPKHIEFFSSFDLTCDNMSKMASSSGFWSRALSFSAGCDEEDIEKIQKVNSAKY